jgi:hypothetical protein
MHRQRQRGMKIAPRIRQLGNMQQHTLNDIHLSDITRRRRRRRRRLSSVCRTGKSKNGTPLPLYTRRVWCTLSFSVRDDDSVVSSRYLAYICHLRDDNGEPVPRTNLQHGK